MRAPTTADGSRGNCKGSSAAPSSWRSIQRGDLDAAIARGDFDAVITDYRLSWTDGLSILKALQERFPYIPVVMLTDMGSEEIAVEGMKARLGDYVLKEHLQRLPVAIKESLEKSRLRKEYEEGILQLKVSEERYRSLIDDVLESSGVGVFILDADFKVVWLNRALEYYFGLRRGEVIGKDKRQIIREQIQ